MLGGIAYLQYEDLYRTLLFAIPFVLVAAPIFIYFGLTQETAHDYGMNKRRALSYSIPMLLVEVFPVHYGYFASAPSS
jgi:hypothetical protein